LNSNSLSSKLFQILILSLLLQGIINSEAVACLKLLFALSDNDLSYLLEVRAVRHGWSMEAEVRRLLRITVSEGDTAQQKLGSGIVRRA